MKISCNWIKELVPDMNQTPEELAELLTMHSFETEVAGTMQIPSGVVAVKITRLDKHPDADRLRLATITTGGDEITVVCGAPNIEVGQVVPYSAPGVVLCDEEGNDFEIKEATIRGQKSPGMLSSLRELGLHPTDHSGIWILPEDTPLGTELADLIPQDTILDADITPNRAHDCLSHIGIAREIAALLQLSVMEPELASVSPTKDGITVQIEDEHDVPRYIVAEITGATPAPSPLWLQAKLLAAGGKPKNNLVDVTNYVLFEYGSPTHLFDASAIVDKSITVRRAKAGESIVALDEEEYALLPEDVVIASGGAPVALGGVMGGLASGVKTDTNDLVLEVASFYPYHVAQTSRRLKLRSESSVRYEKGIHPEQATNAAGRIVHLLQTLADASVASFVDTQIESPEKHHIEFRPTKPAEITNIEIDPDEMSDILQRLRCEVDDTHELWDVTVPYDRLDLEGEHDLVEEVVRVVGLEKIPAKSGDESAHPIDGRLAARMQLRKNLAALGFTETYGYSFEPESYAVLLGLDAKDHLTLVNPPAPELANMRISLLPGLLQQAEKNREAFQKQSGKRERGLFEIGNVYKPNKNATRVPGVDERTYVSGIAVAGVCTPEDILQVIVDTYGVTVDVAEKFGYAKQLDAGIQQKLKYKTPLLAFKLDITEIEMHADLSDVSPASLEEIAKGEITAQFEPYSKYPVATRDISMLVDPAVTVTDAQSVIERVGGALVVDVDLFDEIEWKDTNKKGLAFHVEYQAMDKTLADSDVNKLHKDIEKALQEELEAQIR